MNFSINKNVLLSNILIAQKALSNKTPNPALTGIKIDVNESNLTITTCNSDIAIQLTLEDKSLDVKETGSVLIPGRYFIDIIRKQDAKDVVMKTVDDTIIRITAGRSDITLNMMDIVDYPNLLFTEKIKPIILDVRTLKNIIRQTTFATSSIENKPVLTGVCMKINGNKLKAVATDSYRLSQKEVFLKDSYEDITLILPGKSLDELIKILETNSENVEIHLDNNKVLFKYKNILFQSRLLEGTYPETSRLIPDNLPISIKFNKEDLATAIDRASLLSHHDGNNSIVKLNLRPDNIVEITSNSPEIGKVLEEVYPVEEVTGNPIKIAFSSKYFLDALKVFNSSEVTVHFIGEIRPFIIKGELDKQMLQLILPVITE